MWIGIAALAAIIVIGIIATRRRRGSGGGAGRSIQRPRDDRPTDLDRAP